MLRARTARSNVLSSISSFAKPASSLWKTIRPRSYDLVLSALCFILASGPGTRALQPQLVQPRRCRTGHGILYSG